MGLVAQLYDLSAKEAMALSDREATYMLEAAQVTMFQMATTSSAMKEIMRSRLDQTLRDVRAARSSGGTVGGQSGGPGAPPD